MVEIHLTPLDFTSKERFIIKIKESLDFTLRYSIILRVCFSKDSVVYKMLARQDALVFKDQSLNDAILSDLFDTSSLRLDLSM